MLYGVLSIAIAIVTMALAKKINCVNRKNKMV